VHDSGLGPVHTVSPKMAREQVLDCRRARLAGLDAINERHARQQENSLSPG